jgi:hypothetical protein
MMAGDPDFLRPLSFLMLFWTAIAMVLANVRNESGRNWIVL